MIGKIKSLLIIVFLLLVLFGVGKLYLSCSHSGGGVSTSFSPLPTPSVPEEIAEQIAYNPGLFGPSLPEEVKDKAPIPAKEIKSVIKIEIPEKKSEELKNTPAKKTVILFQDKKGRIYTEKGSEIKVKQVHIKPRIISIEPQFTIQAAFIPVLSDKKIYIAPGLAFTALRVKNLHFGFSITGIKKANRFIYAAGPGGQAAFGKLRLGLWVAALHSKETAQIYFTAGVVL